MNAVLQFRILILHQSIYEIQSKLNDGFNYIRFYITKSIINKDHKWHRQIKCLQYIKEINIPNIYKSPIKLIRKNKLPMENVSIRKKQ